MPLLDRDGVPEHIRALTSRHVLEVEADLTARLAARADTPATTLEPVADGGVGFDLDAAQREVVAALASDRQLVVVEGAAGAGKTTTLAAARTAIEDGGRPAAGGHTDAEGGRGRRTSSSARDAFSAAWLAHQHGYRWDEHGSWTRLEPGQTDPDTGAVYRGPERCRRSCAPVTCCSSMRPGCSTRTPPARC